VLLDMLQVTILLLLTAWLLGKSTDVSTFAWARTAGLLVMAVLGLVMVAVRFGLRPEPGRLLQLGRQGFPFLLADGLGVVYATIDITLVATILGKEAVSIYGPAIVLVNALFMIPNTVYGVLVPVIGRTHTSQPEKARQASLFFIIGLGFLGLVLSGLISLFAAPIIHILYGPDFVTSGPVLAILGFVFFFKSLNFALGGILTAIDWQRERVLVQVGAAVFNVALNLLVIRVYGVMGVAVVYVLTELLLCGGYAVFAMRGSHGLRFGTAA
jgi:O-antigen/teichoic acid export membrane protein